MTHSILPTIAIKLRLEGARECLDRQDWKGAPADFEAVDWAVEGIMRAFLKRCGVVGADGRAWDFRRLLDECCHRAPLLGPACEPTAVREFHALRNRGHRPSAPLPTLGHLEEYYGIATRMHEVLLSESWEPQSSAPAVRIEVGASEAGRLSGVLDIMDHVVREALRKALRDPDFTPRVREAADKCDLGGPLADAVFAARDALLTWTPEEDPEGSPPTLGGILLSPRLDQLSDFESLQRKLFDGEFDARTVAAAFELMEVLLSLTSDIQAVGDFD